MDFLFGTKYKTTMQTTVVTLSQLQIGFTRDRAHILCSYCRNLTTMKYTEVSVHQQMQSKFMEAAMDVL